MLVASRGFLKLILLVQFVLGSGSADLCLYRQGSELPCKIPKHQLAVRAGNGKQVHI